MVKAGEIRPGMQPPSLQQREAEQVKQQQKGKLSAQDQARIASQAGFQRTHRKKGKKGLDIGDSSRSPIPLPDDEVDEETWTSERLDGAQKNLGLASSQFGEMAELDGETSVAEVAVGASFLPTEDSVAQLEGLTKRPAPEPIQMDEVTTNVERLFSIKLDEEIPLGHKVLATGLVVAGESGSVDVGEGSLDEKKLARGLQHVAERCNQAVGEAQRMNKGIDRELNVQRTFVFKR